MKLSFYEIQQGLYFKGHIMKLASKVHKIKLDCGNKIWVLIYYFLHSVLAILNSAIMNTGVHVSLSRLVTLGSMCSSGIAESYSSSIPSF